MQNKDKTARFHVYQQICQNFKPVFRHFFMETFLQPSQWFERRLGYTRSVAATSIGKPTIKPCDTCSYKVYSCHMSVLVCTVGYIVGLGDRHVNNILIDRRTAEVVHIDLG